MRWSVLLLLVCSGCARDLTADNFGKPFEPWVPSDVRAFVVDAQACMHFSGEYGFDAERQAFLQKMIRKTCANIDERARRLREEYPSQQVRQLISDVWE